MKKKIMALGMALLLTTGMLAGCGDNNSKEDYLADIEAFSNLDTGDDTDAENLVSRMEELENVVSKINVKTAEGKDVKKSMKEMVSFTAGLLGDLEKFLAMDEEELAKEQEKLDNLTEELDEDVEEFKEAAKEAGVSEEEIDKMDDAKSGVGLQ